MKDDLLNGMILRRNTVASTTHGQSTSWATTSTFQSGGVAPLTQLTPRQLEVLALLCEGLPNKLICRRLNIATGTVKVHISCILRELGVASRLQAVVMARACGLPAFLAARAAPGNTAADVVAH